MADLASHPVGQPLGGGGVSFGTDGIRGRVGTVMTPALAMQVGYWSGQVLPSDAPVLLGMDSRSSGPMLVAALEALGRRGGQSQRPGGQGAIGSGGQGAG